MKLLLEKSYFLKGSFLIMIILFFGCQEQPNKDINSISKTIDLQSVRSKIEDLDKQFSKDFYNGDSVALANYYASDAKFGSLKGKEILSAWGRMIRNSINDNTRNLLFTTTAFTGDSVYMVELGIYEERDDRNKLKNKGRYLVVWKKENGEWKIYRDIGL
ncbi:MAG: DUF4440 domain-containing protein [Ignavibacteriaceae bacterium]